LPTEERPLQVDQLPTSDIDKSTFATSRCSDVVLEHVWQHLFCTDKRSFRSSCKALKQVSNFMVRTLTLSDAEHAWGADTPNQLRTALQFADITEITLHRVNLTHCGPAIAEWSRLEHLHKLNITQSTISIDTLKGLAEVTNLRQLHIQQVTPDQHSPSYYDEMAAGLGALTSLHSLSLLSLYLPTQHLSALSTLTGLTSLHAHWDCNPSLAALSTLRNLHELSLDGLKLTKEGLRGLQHLTQLTHLEVSGLQLAEAATPAQAAASGQRPKPPSKAPASLRHLAPGINSGWGMPVAQLVRLMPADCKLEQLTTRSTSGSVSAPLNISCADNGYSPCEEGMQMVADNLRTIMQWPLQGNHVDLRMQFKSEAQHVGKALAALEPAAGRLTSVELHHMLLWKWDLEKLAAACPGITALRLVGCKLEPDTLMGLLPMEKLQELDLDHCSGYSAEDVTGFCMAVARPLLLKYGGSAVLEGVKDALEGRGCQVKMEKHLPHAEVDVPRVARRVVHTNGTENGTVHG